MRKILALVLTAFLFLFLVSIPGARASDPCDGVPDAAACKQLEQDISDLQNQLQLSQNATTPLEGQVKGLESQLAGIRARLAQLQSDLAKSEADLVQEKKILAATVRTFYINSFTDIPLLTLFSSRDATETLKTIALQQQTSEENKSVISDISSKVAKLSSEKKSLAALNAQVDKQDQFLKGEIAKAKSFQSELEGQIASLSAQQQALIAAKSGNFSVSVGDATADDANASLSGWNANAPGGSVSVFSFGAYAGNGSNYKRNGMSQYGAWARAKAGQDYNAILSAYYGQSAVDKSIPDTINTDQGTKNFETDYMYGIAEMPSSWTDNGSAALKAQAIAARTYAYHYGGSICTNDHCQVYQSSKASNPPSAWKDAVDSTKGKVLPDGVSAQYVSTPGGYLDTKGWDTTCGDQGCLGSGAYDAASPWFYKAWYTNFAYGQGFSICQRSNPWLSQDDAADILNAWKVYNSGGDVSRILPPDGCGGGNPYSKDEMRQQAGGDAVDGVSGVSVSQNSGGYTSQVTFHTTNKGDITITGFDTGCSHPGGGCKDFWTIFNLRSPGNISIKSRMFDLKIK